MGRHHLPLRRWEQREGRGLLSSPLSYDGVGRVQPAPSSLSLAGELSEAGSPWPFHLARGPSPHRSKLPHGGRPFAGFWVVVVGEASGVCPCPLRNRPAEGSGLATLRTRDPEGEGAVRSSQRREPRTGGPSGRLSRKPVDL